MKRALLEDFRIDIRPLSDLREDQKTIQIPAVPSGAFGNYIFVSEWNAFIFFAAFDAGLVWTGDAKSAYPET